VVLGSVLGQCSLANHYKKISPLFVDGSKGGATNLVVVWAHVVVIYTAISLAALNVCKSKGEPLAFA